MKQENLLSPVQCLKYSECRLKTVRGYATTVFMKGCPMKCLWCHNPESISRKPQLQWTDIRCIGCRSCQDVCSRNSLLVNDKGVEIDHTLCTGCGACAEICPSGALEVLGVEWNADSLADELVKDNEFFKQSSGGVTIGGGESTLQWEFVSSLMQSLKKQDIHICIDTCGICRREALDAILPFADMILFDVKEMDPELHKSFTGTELENVLSSLKYISEYKKTHDKPSEIWIRTPIIPGATAGKANISKIGGFIAEYCKDSVSRWDLLAFNNLCSDKYKRLGLYWRYSDTDLIEQEHIEALAEAARASGVDPDIVRWSGNTR